MIPLHPAYVPVVVSVLRLVTRLIDLLRETWRDHVIIVVVVRRKPPLRET